MSQIFNFPQSGGAGSGPEDPMLEQRVARLEADVSEIKTSVKSIEIMLAEIKGKMGGVEARIAGLPTTWTILGIVFTTWGIGSGIVFAIAKFAK